MKYITLTQGKVATVDDEWHEYLSQWNWCYNGRYAVRYESYKKPCGKWATRTIWMHREINKTPDDMQTDHINMDKLFNIEANLRDCTKSQNNMNRVNQRNSSSKLKGVSWCRAREKWEAQIRKDGKKKFLGRFTSEIEAARAYDKAAKEHFGEFVRLNDV